MLATSEGQGHTPATVIILVGLCDMPLYVYQFLKYQSFIKYEFAIHRTDLTVTASV